VPSRPTTKHCRRSTAADRMSGLGAEHDATVPRARMVQTGDDERAG
jgi:hypothetical protein